MNPISIIIISVVVVVMVLFFTTIITGFLLPNDKRWQIEQDIRDIKWHRQYGHSWREQRKLLKEAKRELRRVKQDKTIV